MEISFAVPGIPVAQPRARAVSIGGHARMYNPSNADAFKASTMHAFREVYQGGPMEGPVSLRVTFLMPRTKEQLKPSTKRKTRPDGRMPHAKRPDVDNMIKAVMDAMTGLAWVDDTQVCDLVAKKYIVARDEQPRCEVLIRELNGCPNA